MQLTLGEFNERNNYNCNYIPTVYKIYEKKGAPGIFL